MARTKKTTTVEEEVIEAPQETKEDGADFDYKDIHDAKTIKDAALDSPPSSDDQPKADEADSASSSSKPGEGEPVPPAEINLEENNRKIAEETAKKTREEIADLLKGDTKQEVKGEYEEFVDRFTQENGRTPSYPEALKFVKDQAKAEIYAEQQKAYEESAQKTKEQEEVDRVRAEHFNRSIDNELNELYSANKLPRIIDENNPNDPGKVARARLFQTMIDVNAKRELEYQSKAKEVYESEQRVPTREELGYEPIASVTRIYTNYYTPPTQQPAGGDAPIFDSNSGGSVGDSESYSYKEIHNTKGFRGLVNKLTGN